MARTHPGRYQGRDPVTGRRMLDGITAIVSERTGEVTYQARWYWYDAADRRHQKTSTRKTLDDAEQTLLAAELQIRQGIYGAESTMTLAVYFEQWYARKQAGNWRSSSAYRVRRDWDAHFREPLGDVALGMITRALCQSVIDRIATARDPERPEELRYKASSVRLFSTVLSGVLEGAFRDGLIPSNPAHRLDLPKKRTTRKKAWAVEDALRFLDAVKGNQHEDLWWFILLSGCRIGEALSLRWSAVDFAADRITLRTTIRREADGSWHEGAGTKTHDEEVAIPMVPLLAERLKVRQRAQRSGRAVIELDGLVFPSPAGGVYRENTIWHALARLTEAHHLPRMSPHGLRHTTASLLASFGVPQSVTKEIMRHKSVRTTVDVYVHTEEGEMRKALDVLGAALSDTTTPPPDEGGVVGIV